MILTRKRSIPRSTSGPISYSETNTARLTPIFKCPSQYTLMMKNLEIFDIALLPIGGGKEKEAFQTLKKHSEIVVDSVEKFKDAIEAYSKGELDEGNNLLHEIDQLESKADKIGEKFEASLGSGAFLPAFRGDLSRLGERVDDVVDMADEGIKEIHLRPRLFEELAEAEEENADVKAIRVGLVDLADKAVDSSKALDAGISVLMENMDVAALRAEEIHRREADSDEAEEELLRNLYKYENLLSPVTVIQIKAAVEQIGGISDVAEDAGDIISAMCVALKA